MAADWSLAEVEAVASDYLSMLARELRNEPYNKSEYRKRLKERLAGRTDGSIERKHQNISAILIESGFPYVSGYKPLYNYQEMLREVVLARLGGDRSLPRLAEAEVTRPVDPSPTMPDVLGLLVEAPAPAERNVARTPAARYPVRPRVGVDYLALEARNGALGQAGEELALAYEVARLRHLGKPKLADRVEPVSRTRGDGLGYDIRSFETSGEDRFIEVKTTGFGKDTPFYVTRTELRFSVESALQFHLYRLFQFRKEPKMFFLNGALDKTCVLDPSQFIARAG